MLAIILYVCLHSHGCFFVFRMIKNNYYKIYLYFTGLLAPDELFGVLLVIFVVFEKDWGWFGGVVKGDEIATYCLITSLQNGHLEPLSAVYTAAARSLAMHSPQQVW